jgi:hypothetical protein
MIDLENPKEWVVKTYYNRNIMELIVKADRSIDARRMIKGQYPTCRVWEVTEVVPSVKAQETK